MNITTTKTSLVSLLEYLTKDKSLTAKEVAKYKEMQQAVIDDNTASLFVDFKKLVDEIDTGSNYMSAESEIRKRVAAYRSLIGC